MKYVERDSEHLGIDSNEFVKEYLGEKNSEGNYPTKHKPCDFLQADGSCKLGDCKPESCKDYPYTINQNVCTAYTVCWMQCRFGR